MRIELAHVTKRFGRVTALDDVTLTIAEGSRVGLIGPNGSGKSTLTRVMMGMIAAEGTVRIGGLSPFADRAVLAERLAYVPQAAPALTVSVRDLVRAVASVRRIAPAVVAERGRELGLDLEEVGNRPLRNLSGGMKQKLMIALALAAPETSLVIMDEPTAGLDVTSRRRFYALFAALRLATLVLCSHRLEVLRHLIDHVVLLDEGRVAWHGPLDAFLARGATSLIEVRATSEARARWLLANGFTPGTGCWWAKSVPRAEKASELARLFAELHGDLSDLLVRDVETVESDGWAREGVGAG
jgi:ABC-type multidrug transport system ATPase subunit